MQEDLFDSIDQSFSAEEGEIIRKAYDYVADRLGSVPDETLRTVQLLLNQRTDYIVISSGLITSLYLYNLAPDLPTLRRVFGKTIANLVASVEDTRLMRTDSEVHRREDMERFLKSLGDDLRSAILRIGLRLAKLERLARTNSKLSRQTARETLDVHVPVARRMGMGRIKGALEDICFRLLEPDIYNELAKQVEPIQAEDEACLEILVAAVRKLLYRNGFKGRVLGRTKNLYSLYMKMQRLNAPLETIMDKIGIRIILPAVTDCYQVLGLLHTHYVPISGTFDDYIGLPKENGYQSLHTCVYPIRDISEKPVEFQIRTELMHMEAEFGVAAHWRYKDAEIRHEQGQRQLRWFESLRKKHNLLATHEDFVARLRKEAFDDALVVFTQKGRTVRLPEGSTARDFVHRTEQPSATNLHVRINGQVESMDYALKDGDTVEIGSGPNDPVYDYFNRQ